jgi:hypothetical protein
MYALQTGQWNGFRDCAVASGTVTVFWQAQQTTVDSMAIPSRASGGDNGGPGSFQAMDSAHVKRVQ